MSIASQAVSVLQRIGLVILIGLAFLFGLTATVYLSLRSPEVTVPEVVGKDRFEAERILGEAGLNFRVRATRPSNEVKADTVLFQLPRAGEVVKHGQTVAMDISRTAREGEASEAVVNDKKVSEEKAAESRNANASDANENRPRRRPVNRNVNGNENANVAGSNLNVNRPRVIGNVNSDAVGTGARNVNSAGNVNASRNANVNRNANQNVNRSANQNVNRRPAAPKPSPTRP